MTVSLRGSVAYPPPHTHTIMMQFTKAHLGLVMLIFTQTLRFSGRPYVQKLGRRDSGSHLGFDPS